MKKKWLAVILFGLLLTSCNGSKNETNENTNKPSPEVVEPTTPKDEFSNEQIRVMLKNDYRYYKEDVSGKNQLNLQGEIIAPDAGSTGMYNYKLGLEYKTGLVSNESGTIGGIDISSIIDKIPGLGGNGSETSLLPSIYLKASYGQYLMQNNEVSKTPVSEMKLIRKTELNDVIDYELTDNKTYIKTVDRNGTLPFAALVGAISAVIKDFKLEDFPVDAKYSYTKGGIYGIEFTFKDLEGTTMMENIDFIMGLVPELAEVFYQYKDSVVISVSNLQLKVKKTTFDLAVKYPIGGFMFEAIKGKFNLKYTCIPEDVSKFKIEDTYYTLKQGNNTITSKMLKEEKQEDKTVYTTSMLLSSLTSLSLKDIEDLKKVLNRKYQIVCNDAIKIEYFDRDTMQPIEVVDNKIDLDLLERILVKLTFENNLVHTVNLNDISTTPDDGGSDLPSENL